MKALAAAVAILVAVALLPAVLVGGDRPDVEACGGAIDTDHLDVILTTIRTVESGGRYDARASDSTASGAYQFIDHSWRHYAELAGVDTASYPSAWMASPGDQDATAAAYLNELVADHDGRIDVIPLAWYLPAAIDHPQLMDVVPMPEAGNVLTPRQYQARWMYRYDTELRRADRAPTAGSSTTVASSNAISATAPDVETRPGGCSGGSVTPLAGDWSLPGPRTVIAADPDAMASAHHDYPAWDWIVAINTPIYAVRGGHVEGVRTWPHNWWSRGCQRVGVSGCDTCGVGVTIVDSDGHRWTYCHGSNLTVRLGDHVTAGQQVLWSGNSGRSGTPHLHLEIRTNGARRCPQPLLESLYHRGVGLDPATLPTGGCTF